MTDAECVDFLRWALPRLDRRWDGYRRVRRLVAKRLARRLRLLGLPDLVAYRARLESDRAEWAELDALLGIPISRFYRDRDVFESIGGEVLPALARAAQATGRTTLACLSAGCASGEEPYSLAMIWRRRVQPAFPALALHIAAVDSDPLLLERARAGCFGAGSLKELPADLRAAAFELRGGRCCVRPEYRDNIEFLHQDLRRQVPDGPFDLVLLRNVVATYYAAPVQREIMARIASRMLAGAALVLGAHESLPQGAEGFAAWPGVRCIWRRATSGENR